MMRRQKISDRLQQDLKEAMRAQDQQQRVHVIRLLMAALEKAQEEKGKEAFDASPFEGDIRWTANSL